MQLTTVSVLSLLVGGTFAKLHNAAVCVTNRRFTPPPGGNSFSPTEPWYKEYDIAIDATKCACDMYSQRNTGDNQWDKCPDCTFDGNFCNSAGWHIGGDEMTYYCEKKCGAQGAEAN